MAAVGRVVHGDLHLPQLLLHRLLFDGVGEDGVRVGIGRLGLVGRRSWTPLGVGRRDDDGGGRLIVSFSTHTTRGGSGIRRRSSSSSIIIIVGRKAPVVRVLSAVMYMHDDNLFF